MYLSGYKRLNWHVVKVRHQHKLQQSLQIRWRIAAVSAVFRSPNASILSVQLCNNPLNQRAKPIHFIPITASQKTKHRKEVSRETSAGTKDKSSERQGCHSYLSVLRQAFWWLWPISFHIREIRFTSWASDTNRRGQKNLSKLYQKGQSSYDNSSRPHNVWLYLYQGTWAGVP